MPREIVVVTADQLIKAARPTARATERARRVALDLNWADVAEEAQPSPPSNSE